MGKLTSKNDKDLGTLSAFFLPDNFFFFPFVPLNFDSLFLMIFNVCDSAGCYNWNYPDSLQPPRVLLIIIIDRFHQLSL